MGPPSALADAVELHRAGRLAEAERAYRALLDTDPGNADVLHFLGMLRAQLGDLAEGIGLLQRAIAQRPDVALYHSNLGKALADRKAWPEAIMSYRHAARLAPGDSAARTNLGLVLAAAGDAAGAEAELRAALVVGAPDPRVHAQLGLILYGQARFQEAEACFRAYLAAQPDDPDALFNCGCACRWQGKLLEAEGFFRRALSVRPDFVGPLEWLAGIRFARGDLDEAASLVRQALQIDPKNWGALITRGQIFMAFAEFKSARDAFARAAELNAAAQLARHNALIVALYDPAVDGPARAEIHRQYGRAVAAQVGRRSPRPANRPAAERLRVGWLSSDFRAHPIARNIEPIFAHRNRARFEYICYFEEAEKADAITAGFRSRSDLWRPVTGMSDAAVADQIRADRVDVMIYLAGRFDNNRPEVAAWRPAPVQVSFHDPATSGLAEMDYLIADPVLVPRRTAEWFSERVVRLPHFYVHAPMVGAPDVGPLPMLSSGRVTFGCFNNPAKLGGPPLALWGRILERLPTARLRLAYRTLFSSRRLQESVQAQLGVARGRVDFDAADRTADAHLRLYNEIDIALDPFPFAGSTTTFEALWMGVPVVTLLGDNMASRWSAALLHALGLQEMVARTPEEYAEIVLRLASEPERLGELRDSLRERVAGSPLCDGARLTRHFERLIGALWRFRRQDA